MEFTRGELLTLLAAASNRIEGKRLYSNIRTACLKKNKALDIQDTEEYIKYISKDLERMKTLLYKLREVSNDN